MPSASDSGCATNPITPGKEEGTFRLNLFLAGFFYIHSAFHPCPGVYQAER